MAMKFEKATSPTPKNAIVRFTYLPNQLANVQLRCDKSFLCICGRFT